MSPGSLHPQCIPSASHLCKADTQLHLLLFLCLPPESFLPKPRTHVQATDAVSVSVSVRVMVRVSMSVSMSVSVIVSASVILVVSVSVRLRAVLSDIQTYHAATHMYARAT